MSPKKATQKPRDFTAEERAAARERVKEQKAGALEGEPALLAKIAELKEPDRSTARRLHELVKANAPGLSATTWYGMPAWANAEGKILCHFQSAQKFRTRYPTLGFSDKANLDEGGMWPVAFALTAMTSAEEAKVAALLKRAVG
ncbi:MAG TPA: hypothetical protein VH208_02490 [Myxococcaceae bacterium]|nr:hypothetical protein [Myxococcaceae bacterium]